jgi:hypothetical protein
VLKKLGVGIQMSLPLHRYAPLKAQRDGSFGPWELDELSLQSCVKSRQLLPDPFFLFINLLQL